MVRVLFDSTIEIWAVKYINFPEVRALEDLDKEIQQIEAIPGCTDFFIVEVFKPAREGGENERAD